RDRASLLGIRARGPTRAGASSGSARGAPHSVRDLFRRHDHGLAVAPDGDGLAELLVADQGFAHGALERLLDHAAVHEEEEDRISGHRSIRLGLGSLARAL